MPHEENPIGNIEISSRAIATIAYQAVIQTYGVVGLASKNLIDGLTHILVKDPTHGIDVEVMDENIAIHIYVIVQYGTRIKTVADSIAEAVKFNVEKALGLPVDQVNVHVQGLRISEPE